MAIAFTACFGLMGAGAAMAVSGGGFNPDQQDCGWSTDASNSFGPSSATPGCHNAALNVESGGTSNGDPNSNDTRYAEVGLNQAPQVDGNPSFGSLYNLGDPGTPGAEHGGCVAANTDGTGGGTGTGCGSNDAGTGVSGTFDYYELYCPATNGLPVPLSTVPWVKRGSIPDPTGGNLDSAGLPALYNCDPRYSYGHNGLTPSQGTNQKLSDIAMNGLLVYYGMDDNSDNGEHDGYSSSECVHGTGPTATPPSTCVPGNAGQAVNGPSDGGAVMLSITPQNAANTPKGHNPEGAANFSTGFCADGICTETTTQQQTVYYGCGATQANSSSPGHADCANPADANSSQDVYRNGSPASTQEQPGCQSGDSTVPTECYTNSGGNTGNNPGGPNTYVANTPHYQNAEPGVQTYEDPDPQRSPVTPFGIPGAYVGTCGVYVNDGSSSVGPSIYDFARSQGLPTPALPTKGSSGTIIDQPSGLC